ncbi:MAG TPA: hypothetical protein VER96_08375 [Polyangiaceae bacterium]|nr:hypothetical protein [Polyangiaceae bacterium]
MYIGQKIDDLEILAHLPAEYRRLLETANGYVAYHGGLHIRGACLLPEWHSLRSAWFGEEAIHRLFAQVLPEDIPFAEDCLGDQFILRDNLVWKLRAESGDLVALELTLAEFDAAARSDPNDFLELGPLHQFRSEGGSLLPGQLLSVYPPFLFAESGAGVHLRLPAEP